VAQAPELSVVCRSCGSEVSPYVTECPYCGARIRKRAPRLEREGDEIKVRESRRDRRRRLRRERAADRAARTALGVRPIATAGTLLIGAVLLILGRAVPLTLSELGAIVGPVGGEAWRYVTAPFVYDDLGALFVLSLAIWVFGAAIEQRLGSLATATLILATGTLGSLAAGAVYSAGLTDTLVVVGGNAIALGLLGAWLMLWRGEAKSHFSEPLETIALTVTAIVLLLLPLVEVGADPVAGLVGGLVGLAMGALAARRTGHTG
jgi:membrane associated rhomboid family serine protease/DNA-directed RNA polymerase subunit RPC12/RpoP